MKVIANNKNIILIISSLILLVYFTSIQSVSGIEEKIGENVAYVVCEDRRVYKIDLDKKEVVYKTDEIDALGKPTAIDIDSKKGKLYIASERGHWQMKYSPIVVLDITTLPMQVLNSFNLIVEDAGSPFVGSSAVYDLVVSPDGKSLYISYSHPKYQKGSTIVDSKTGEIKGHLDFYINAGSIFSPDEKKIAEIWPSGSRLIEKNKGKELKEWSGGVAIYNIEQNKKISHSEGQKDKIGLYSPWEKIELPYVYLKNYKILQKYNRENGEIISEIDLEKLTGGLNTSIRYPLIFDKNTKAIIPMLGKEWQGYIVVIDLEKKEIISRIEVGKFPTNVVLGK